MTQHGDIKVIYRDSVPPEHPMAHWGGFAPGRSVLPAGSVYSPNGRSLVCDIVLDRDVEVPLRDGTIIYTDVYRPAGDDTLPAILAWSPYGKQGGTSSLDAFPNRAGVPESATSGLEKFEGPDPAFWCNVGYAVVNIDPRGAFASGGNGQMFSPQEARDGYDAIEWIARQDWCSGQVVMSGNSWLSISQWRIAALRPPHLTAIAPWEGLTDVYRDLAFRGGIPDPVIMGALMRQGRNQIEDLPAMMREYPLMNEYWASKIADIESIGVPAYVVASWTNPFHTRGTLDAFARLDQARSWLRIHNTHEWPDYYEYEGDLRRFFDHVVKGLDNGWQATPTVRLSVLDPGGSDVVNRPEESWPLARAQVAVRFLDAPGGALTPELPPPGGHVDLDGTGGAVEFHAVMTEDADIVGPLKVRLHMEVIDAEDADIFVFVRKLDAGGVPLLTRHMGLPFAGAKGQLRLSHREVDADASTPLVPVLAHRHALPMAAGQVEAVEVPIWPMGMRWHAGQQLQVIVSASDLQISDVDMAFGRLEEKQPAFGLASEPGSPRLRIHTGGEYDSQLVYSTV